MQTALFSIIGAALGIFLGRLVDKWLKGHQISEEEVLPVGHTILAISPALALSVGGLCLLLHMVQTTGNNLPLPLVLALLLYSCTMLVLD